MTDLKINNFGELISFIIDSEDYLGLENGKKIVKKLEEIRDIAVELLSKSHNSKPDMEEIRFLKEFFCIRWYDPHADGLMEDLERDYWRIIRTKKDGFVGRDL